jgi:hypothetical protein
MCIRVSVQRNHLFGKTNAQKMVAKVKNLRTEENPSFVYLCICVSGQINHSLSLFLYAILLVSIPSYVYFSDGYNQGVGEMASQK